MTNEIVGVIIAGILGGSTIAALINQIGEGIRQRRKRKYENEDAENDDISVMKNALKWVLYDRIRYLAQVFIAEGCVDFDDRRVLNTMHECYHALGGNGDLDVLMKEVNSLPLKSS